MPNDGLQWMKCCQMPPEPDAARCQSSDATGCQMPPDASCQMPPPGPGGGLGEVSRATVLMSFVLISGTCCRRQFWGPPGCDDERRAPAVKSGVPLVSMSPVQLFCSALPFTGALSRLSPPAAPRSQTSTTA